MSALYITKPALAGAIYALNTARRIYALALEECPHWDYTTDDGGGHECCENVSHAQDALRQARKRYRSATT